MQTARPIALAASVLFLAATLPASNAEPSTVPLEVTTPQDLADSCVAAVAVETPAEREGRLASAKDYVRLFYPDLAEAALEAAAELLLAERCQFRLDAPPAHKERVGEDHWVVHFGEHSIVHDLYHSYASVSDPSAPIHLVFYGIPFGTSARSVIQGSMESAGWEIPPWWDCEGEDSPTTKYDARHGGVDDYDDMTDFHMQPASQACWGERRHLKVWVSPTGDTHSGATYGGYGLGASHYDDFQNGGHKGVQYDATRERVRNDLVRSGTVDGFHYVNAGSTNPARGAHDGKVLYLHMKRPAVPCATDSIVRIYEDPGYLGQCRAFNADDPNLTDDFFDNGASLNDRASSIKVASGYRAVLYEHVAPKQQDASGSYFYNYGSAGATRSSKCSDNQFVQGSFNERASALRIERVHLATCYGTFSNVRGGANYVEAVFTSSWQPQSLQVRVHNGGPWSSWMPMTKQVSGVWTASPAAGSSSTVQLRAVVGTGGGADLSPCYDWVPPAGANAATVYCPDPFKASFSGVQGNAWWVQASLTSNQDVDRVEFRLSCAPYHEASSWRPLAKQSWGGWAASPSSAIPAGTKVDFRAHGIGTLHTSGTWQWTASEFDVSVGYLWPSSGAATATSAC